MTLLFPDTDALRFALTGGAVPDDVLARPAQTGTDEVGRTWVAFESPLDDETAALLSRLGIGVTESITDGQRIEHWWQLLAPVRADVDVGRDRSVLFVTASETRLDRVIQDCLRLGSDRLAVRRTSAGDMLLRVEGPPHYVMLTALDRDDPSAPRAFVEQSDKLWVEVGYRQPLAEHIAIAPGLLMFVNRAGRWETVTDEPFHDIDEVIRFARVDESRFDVAPVDAGSLAVEVRLVAGSPPGPPTLWVIRDNALAIVDALVAGEAPEVFNRWGFMETNTMILLRARPSRTAPPDLSLTGQAFREYAKIPNLFVPVGQRLDPPLRRDTIRSLLAPDVGMVYWLTPSAEGTLTVESVPEAAFRPLREWPEATVARERTQIEEWIRATRFDFADYWQVEEVPKPRSVTTKPKSPVQNKPASKPAREPTSRLPRLRDPRQSARVETASALPLTPTAARAHLTELEQQFVAVDGPLDAPPRRELWPSIARLNTELREPADAALAWMHALWTDAPADEHLWGWVWSEGALARPELTSADLDRLLAPSAPSVSEVRAVVAMLSWAARQRPVPAVLTARLPELRNFLRQNDDRLPMRAAWLGWSAWCRASAGDELALARERDRLLTRLLERGLVAELDLPAFLRFAGRGDGERVREVRRWAEEIRFTIRQWYFSATAADPATDPTGAYIDALFAFTQARLGEARAARSLLRGAEAVLAEAGDDTRAAHDLLLWAFDWRVEQALAARPHAGPLPAEWHQELVRAHADIKQMPITDEYNTRRTAPYAVERFREQSRVLEPQEKFDPYRQTRREGHEVLHEATRLPDERDPGRLHARISELLRKTASKPGLRLRLLADCVPLAGRLGATAGGQLLGQVVGFLDAEPVTGDSHGLQTRFRVAERALFFSAHFDRGDLIGPIADRLVALFRVAGAGSALDEAGPALGQTLQSLRKLGRRDDTERILVDVGAALLNGQPLANWLARKPRGWPGVLNNLLHLAAGWLGIDRPDEAEPILAAARRALSMSGRPGQETISAPQYAAMACNYLAAVGLLRPEEAKNRIAELFGEGRLNRLPNTFTTATFYSRLHLNVAETAVLTLASEDFALGPGAKRWLDEDEFLIRRRIHAEVRAAVEKG